MATRRSNPNQLRLPDGLRERIKTYAERHGRSMNAEIVRILEREFPEPWRIEDRVNELVDLAKIYRDSGDAQNLERLNEALRETLQGVVSRRVKGLDPEACERIDARMVDWEINTSNDRYHADKERLDPEEFEQLHVTGKTAKYD